LIDARGVRACYSRKSWQGDLTGPGARWHPNSVPYRVACSFHNPDPLGHGDDDDSRRKKNLAASVISTFLLPLPSSSSSPSSPEFPKPWSSYRVRSRPPFALHDKAETALPHLELSCAKFIPLGHLSSPCCPVPPTQQLHRHPSPDGYVARPILLFSSNPLRLSDSLRFVSHPRTLAPRSRRLDF
jgi:hypothetical protein